jgi:aryl-alcohol dehydrogenase-like predicted oxidoreductase
MLSSMQGAVPIAGAKNAEQARENAAALGVSSRLEAAEVAELARLGRLGGVSNWQHG